MFLFLFLCEFRDSAGQQQTHFQDPSAGESRCRKASRMETMPPSWRILHAESFLLISGLHRSCVSLRRTHTPLQRRLLSQKEPRVNTSDCVFKCLSGRGGCAAWRPPHGAHSCASVSIRSTAQQPLCSAARCRGAQVSRGTLVQWRVNRNCACAHTHTCTLVFAWPKENQRSF